MDLGRARYRQAHRLPPARWELGLFVICVIVTLAAVATAFAP